MKQAVLVSPEMTTLIGRGELPQAPLPPEPVVFAFAGVGQGVACTVAYRDRLDLAGLTENPLVFVVSREACRRIFAIVPDGDCTWHLPNALCVLALSIIDPEADGEAGMTLRLARSIELLCQFHAALEAGSLVPVTAEHRLSEMDVARIAVARRIVDQRWQEKLTLPELARLAGINRDKLMRGFRELFGATVAEILAERRLCEAHRLLLGSDLPVASVAYRCSYRNNASFTRAFSRRFGVAPTALRRMGAAA